MLQPGISLNKSYGLRLRINKVRSELWLAEILYRNSMESEKLFFRFYYKRNMKPLIFLFFFFRLALELADTRGGLNELQISVETLVYSFCLPK